MCTVVIGAMCLAAEPAAQRPRFDVMISNGRIVDGTGAPWDRGDVGIVGDRITAVGALGDATAAAKVDASNLVVAPGFIDLHTHYDAQVFWDWQLSPSCWHGVTSVVMGNCGFSIAPGRPGLDHVGLAGPEGGAPEDVAQRLLGRHPYRTLAGPRSAGTRP